MFPDTQRWSRGCGSGGLGPPLHTQGDGYRDGVLEKNWVQELAGREMRATGRTVWNTGFKGRAQSTQRASYTAQGKVGQDLIEVSQRHDQDLQNQGQTQDILMRHGHFLGRRMDCSTTLNSLTYGEKRLDEPPVQSYLWTGSNSHNRSVPVKAASNLDLTRKKAEKWSQDGDPYGTYKTTWRAAALPSALKAAEYPSKTATLRPTVTVGDQDFAAHIGRKPTGPFVEECDKNYRRIGMRDTWCTFLTTLKR